MQGARESGNRGLGGPEGQNIQDLGGRGLADGLDTELGKVDGV